MNSTNYSFAHARRLNEICDCPCGCREQQADEFLKLNLANLPVHLKVEYLYILGKFYFHRSKSSNRLENLETSNSYFDQVFIVSKDARLEVKSPKKWFKSAHTKFELSKRVSNLGDVSMLKQKAIQITNEAYSKFPDNKSLIWLKQQLSK